jgi:hypothetical protein
MNYYFFVLQIWLTLESDKADDKINSVRRQDVLIPPDERNPAHVCCFFFRGDSNGYVLSFSLMLFTEVEQLRT